MPSIHLAVIGSGASAIYLLKHLLDALPALGGELEEVAIFEKSSLTGMGMPYNPLTTDRFNLANISSEELPALPETFAGWLRRQEEEVLEEFGLRGQEISESEVYSRLALGRYLQAQYRALVGDLQMNGVRLREYADCEITDIRDDPEAEEVTLTAADGEVRRFGRVVIATGHSWSQSDVPERGYFSSPWPIAKLLPAPGTYFDFPIGTLGASLSAFDVITTLAHRHGTFRTEGDELIFEPHAEAGEFRIVMHSAEGLLPHLQYEMEKPLREIYRHVDRDGLLALENDEGFLRLAAYFDRVCRPALAAAFVRDGMPAVARKLGNAGFTIEDFVEAMTGKHKYADAFDGMRAEMKEARDSVENDRPIRWKEVLDDLIYTLSYHAELMPAEDHLALRHTVMPFLMNVIAALPLKSARTLLALRNAGKLDLVAGIVTLPEEQDRPGETIVEIESEDGLQRENFRMFVDCGGQKALDLEQFPFPGLVRPGAVRAARAVFADPAGGPASASEEDQSRISLENGRPVCRLDGIDIDSAFRVIGREEKANPRIFDIAFPHTSGVRPYAYGLQACSETSAILVQAWASAPRHSRDAAVRAG